MLHFITLSSVAPAAARHSFMCSSTSSVWRATGSGLSSPVSGSNGGRPETNTMLPARVTGEAGTGFQRLRKVEIGSTRSASRFICSPSIWYRWRQTSGASRRHASETIEVWKQASDDAGFPQALDLLCIETELAAEHLLGVLAEPRRVAVLRHWRCGKRQRVADQGQRMFEGVVDLHLHAARADVRIRKHLR